MWELSMPLILLGGCPGVMISPSDSHSPTNFSSSWCSWPGLAISWQGGVLWVGRSSETLLIFRRRTARDGQDGDRRFFPRKDPVGRLGRVCRTLQLRADLV